MVRMSIPSVDIFVHKAEGYDIVLLNATQYLNMVQFNFIIRYIASHAKLDITDAEQCSHYERIAIRLKGHLADRVSRKKELYGLLLDALQLID
jgi:hypothetical protein